MTIARDGLPYVAGAAGLAVLTFAIALNRRSWLLWLLALALIVATLILAYVLRDAAGSPTLGPLPSR